MQTGVYSCGVGMLFACLMGGAVVCAQQSAGIHSENGVYTLHEDTHLVLLDVTVTNTWGHPVDGLTKDDFKLLEDGQPQTIKFFEEHAPIDPIEIARQKTAALANQPPNTFTSYEPLTGRPVTVLVLNLLTIPGNMSGGAYGLYVDMLNTVQKSPPDTPFAIYVLDSELRLVQPITTDHALLLEKIQEIGDGRNILSNLPNPRNPVVWNDPVVGNQSWPKSADAQDALVSARRTIMMTAMQQLSSGLKDAPGRKSLFFFTGGLSCELVTNTLGCSFSKAAFPNSNEFLCGLMDTLEQGRIWAYLDYGRGHIEYGFGCRSTGAPLQDIQGTSSQYYTLYYAPTNQDWNGKYRKTTVEAKNKGLHLAYRQGYYGTPENAGAHYYTTNRPKAAVAPAASSGPTITATTVIAGTAGSEGLGADSAKTPPNPTAAIFSVQVVPAAAKSAADKEKQEYRQLMLHFSMPASEFKVLPSGAGQYAARLEINAVPYADSKALETYGSEVAANFNGATDPRIANSTITATLTVNIPEHGRDRWLDVSVRDMATGSWGNLVIPMERVKMPGTQ